jgi:nicotinate-nucleotide pyrophosphorylase (carboxylating)
MTEKLLVENKVSESRQTDASSLEFMRGRKPKCDGDVLKIVSLALQEDIGTGDITAALIPQEKDSQAKIISRDDAVLCGKQFVEAVFHALNSAVRIEWFANDGDLIHKNQRICEIFGKARFLLTGERTALNFLQTLSSTATQTKKFVEVIQGTNTTLLDTRKTLPGLRLAQKYAVSCGGGKNHRMGLFDAFLIKENHIEAIGSITKAITRAREIFSDKIVEVEVKSLDELTEAIIAKADIIMLDNFTLDNIKKAVEINNKKAKLEVSGGVDLTTIRKIAETGIDYISVGAITKNIVATDFSMLFQ